MFGFSSERITLYIYTCRVEKILTPIENNLAGFASAATYMIQEMRPKRICTSFRIKNKPKNLVCNATECNVHVEK
jgi:hypothetical protein